MGSQPTGPLYRLHKLRSFKGRGQAQLGAGHLQPLLHGVRRNTQIEGHLLSSLMAQTALEAFPLGCSQAQDRCPLALVDHFHPHVGEHSALRAGTNPVRLVPHRSIPFWRRRCQDQLMVRPKADGVISPSRRQLPVPSQKTIFLHAPSCIQTLIRCLFSKQERRIMCSIQSPQPPRTRRAFLEQLAAGLDVKRALRAGEAVAGIRVPLAAARSGVRAGVGRGAAAARAAAERRWLAMLPETLRRTPSGLSGEGKLREVRVSAGDGVKCEARV
jgi:hypothetical protein